MGNYNTKSVKRVLEKTTYGIVVTGDGSSPYTTFTATATAGSIFSVTDNYYVVDTVYFTSGVGVNGLSAEIASYTAGTGEFTIEDIGVAIPNGATFSIYDTVKEQDDFHSTPFSNLSMLIQPMDTTTYEYDIIYGDESQQSGTVTNSKEMVTYTDNTQTFPANNKNSNWAFQERGNIIIEYPIYAKIVHKADKKVVYNIAINSQTLSTVI